MPEEHAAADKDVHGVRPAVVVDQRALREDSHRQRLQLVVAATPENRRGGGGGRGGSVVWSVRGGARQQSN